MVTWLLGRLRPDRRAVPARPPDPQRPHQPKPRHQPLRRLPAQPHTMTSARPPPHRLPRGKQLCMEGHALERSGHRRMARRCSFTPKPPCWRHWLATSGGFAGRQVQICYAMKANPSLGVLQAVCASWMWLRHCVCRGAGRGRWPRVLRRRKSFSLASAKHAQKCGMRSEVGIGCFNVESEAEIGRAQ